MTITIVSGFQRCGSSLVMQMLAAARIPIVHDPDMGYPSFESSLNLRGAPLDSFDGYAIKWLEPLHAMPPRGSVRFQTIWMTRDHLQQALSAVKFMRLVMGMPVRNATVSQFIASYHRDEAPSIALWKRRGPVLIQSFEDLLTDGERSAETIARFIGRDLPVAAMVQQIRQRGTDCLPGMLEVDLIETAEASSV